LDVLGDGGGGWLKSVSLAQKLIIIESACARDCCCKGFQIVTATGMGVHAALGAMRYVKQMA